jgi:hypothetical protein
MFANNPDVSGELSAHPLCMGDCEHRTKMGDRCGFEYGGICTCLEALKRAIKEQSCESFTED